MCITLSDTEPEDHEVDADVISNEPHDVPPSNKRKREKRGKNSNKPNNENFPIKCWRKRCPNFFESREAMMIHVASFHRLRNEKTFECHLCKKKYPILLYLQKHMNEKHGHHTIFICPISKCSRIFYRWSNRKSHVASIHRKRERNMKLNAGTIDAPKTDNFSIKCGSWTCKEYFENWASMKYHQEMYHRKGIKRTFQCYLCRKTLVSRQMVHRHVNSSHLGQYVCPFSICSETFRHARVLKWHIKSIHERNPEFSATNEKFVEGSNKGNGSVKCAYQRCEYIFESWDAMVYHMESFHWKRIAKTFECFLCHQTLSNSWQLKTHINCVHSHRESFKCTFPMCSKIYYSKHVLRNHMRCGHTTKVIYRTGNDPLAKSNVPSDRSIEHFPIKCARGACKEVFESVDAVMYHRTVFHRPGLRKSFECHVCKKSVVGKFYLMQHMNALHGPQHKFKYPVSGCCDVFHYSASICRHLKEVHGKKVEYRPRCKNVLNASGRGARK